MFTAKPLYNPSADSWQIDMIGLQRTFSTLSKEKAKFSSTRLGRSDGGRHIPVKSITSHLKFSGRKRHEHSAIHGTNTEQEIRQ
jgi:hypothetical protein